MGAFSAQTLLPSWMFILLPAPVLRSLDVLVFLCFFHNRKTNNGVYDREQKSMILCLCESESLLMSGRVCVCVWSDDCVSPLTHALPSICMSYVSSGADAEMRAR